MSRRASPRSRRTRKPTARHATEDRPTATTDVRSCGPLYVYFVYGMHYCVNIVTGREGDGQAVLLRAVTCDGVDPKVTNGPAKLCRHLGIDLSMNGAPAMIFDDGTPPPPEPRLTKRIGITKAADMLRRWVVP